MVAVPGGSVAEVQAPGKDRTASALLSERVSGTGGSWAGALE